MESLRKVARALNVTTNYLLFGLDDTERRLDLAAQALASLSDTVPMFRQSIHLHSLTDDADNTTQTIHKTENNKHRRRKRLARFSLAAASFVVLCTVFFKSTAIGASFWQSIAQWTRETFGFARKEAIVVNVELESLHEALEEYGIPDMLSPTWLPEGFVQSYFNVDDTPKRVKFTAHFNNDTLDLVVQITLLRELSSGDYEKDVEDAVPHRRNEIDHFIITNKGIARVVWAVENYECFISGDITDDEAEKMIISIYER